MNSSNGHIKSVPLQMQNITPNINKPTDIVTVAKKNIEK